MGVTSGRVTTNQISRTTFYVKWSQVSQSVENNETTIDWEAGINNGNYDRYYSNAVKIYSVYINGVLVSNGGTWSNINPSASDIGLLSGRVTIPHSSDGTKIFSISISAWTYSSSYYSGSDSFQLTNIPRKATILTAQDFTDEGNPTITYSNSARNNVTSLEACISITGTDDIPYRAISKTGNSYTFNLTAAERNTIRNIMSIYKEVNCSFVLKTTIGGNTYYDYSFKKITIVNANPTIDTKTYEDTNATTLAVTSNNQLIIQNKSTLQFNFTNLKAYKSALLSKISININGVVKEESLVGGDIASYTFNYGVVDVSQNIDAIVTIKDGRGNTTSYNIPLTILEYFNPTAIITVKRKSNYYAESTIKVDADYASLNSINTIAIKFRQKKTIDNNWSAWTNLSDNVVTNFNADNQYQWDIQVQLDDILSTKTYTLTSALDIGIPLVFYDMLKRSVGINCFPQKTASFEIDGNSIYDILYPVHSIYMSTNNVNPSLLFPNTQWTQLKDRFLLGAGNTYTAGNTGGAATVALTEQQMPSHSHSGTTNSDGSHSHKIPSTYNAFLNGSGGSFTGGSSDPYNANTSSDGSHTHSFTTGTAGSGQAHNNMPPYLVVYMWERIS